METRSHPSRLCTSRWNAAARGLVHELAVGLELAGLDGLGAWLRLKITKKKLITLIVCFGIRENF
jgi:hypothetical protein